MEQILVNSFYCQLKLNKLLVLKWKSPLMECSCCGWEEPSGGSDEPPRGLLIPFSENFCVGGSGCFSYWHPSRPRKRWWVQVRVVIPPRFLIPCTLSTTAPPLPRPPQFRKWLDLLSGVQAGRSQAISDPSCSHGPYPLVGPSCWAGPPEPVRCPSAAQCLSASTLVQARVVCPLDWDSSLLGWSLSSSVLPSPLWRPNLHSINLTHHKRTFHQFSFRIFPPPAPQELCLAHSLCWIALLIYDITSSSWAATESFQLSTPGLLPGAPKYILLRSLLHRFIEMSLRRESNWKIISRT